jgi:hypothetical protein
MSRQSSVVLSSKEQSDYLAFERDFEKHLKDLSAALAKSKAVSASAAELKNKGTLSIVLGSLNGKNDKDLADMTGSLAASLTVTQAVLQIVMSISHRKNGFLKQFHEVLVNKIRSLTKDTKTIDSNQREAIIVVLEEIENHVSGQLAQQEMVDQHETRLESIDEYIGAADIQTDDFRNKLALFGLDLGGLREAGIKLRTDFDTEKIRGDAQEIATEAICQNLDVVAASVKLLDEQAQHVEQSVAELRANVSADRTCIDEQKRVSTDTWESITELEKSASTHMQEIDTLKTNADAQRMLIDEQEVIISRQAQRNDELDLALATVQARLATQEDIINDLNATISESLGLRSRLLRNALPLAALTLAAISLLQLASLAPK